MIHRAGAGPSPIPQKELTADKLSDAFKYAVSEDASKAAQKMGEQIRSENGEEKGVSSFHRHLPLMNMRSVICPSSCIVAEQADVMLIQSGLQSGSRRNIT
jgi:sterol 3beta-glucosyltransferase